jgi:hypothetical protein
LRNASPGFHATPPLLRTSAKVRVPELYLMYTGPSIWQPRVETTNTTENKAHALHSEIRNAGCLLFTSLASFLPDLISLYHLSFGNRSTPPQELAHRQGCAVQVHAVQNAPRQVQRAHPPGRQRGSRRRARGCLKTKT